VPVPVPVLVLVLVLVPVPVPVPVLVLVLVLVPVPVLAQERAPARAPARACRWAAKDRGRCSRPSRRRRMRPAWRRTGGQAQCGCGGW
jgi:hypothetical protein